MLQESHLVTTDDRVHVPMTSVIGSQRGGSRRAFAASTVPRGLSDRNVLAICLILREGQDSDNGEAGSNIDGR